MDSTERDAMGCALYVSEGGQSADEWITAPEDSREAWRSKAEQLWAVLGGPAAVLAEREECAKVADHKAEAPTMGDAREIAFRIRART